MNGVERCRAVVTRNAESADVRALMGDVEECNALSVSTLHHFIVQTIIDRCYAPTVKELTERFACPVENVEQCMVQLEEAHGVVTHPASSEVWVIHPFALAPTNFIVRSGNREYWGNCAWCSLGVAALIAKDDDVSITTALGAVGEQVSIRINGEELLDTDYVIHFPIPMRRAWENVHYTCSLMQLFRRESDVDAWCTRHGIAKGDVRPVEQMWRFAREWYGKHADVEWRKWTASGRFALRPLATCLRSLFEQIVIGVLSMPGSLYMRGT